MKTASHLHADSYLPRTKETTAAPNISLRWLLGLASISFSLLVLVLQRQMAGPGSGGPMFMTAPEPVNKNL